MWQAHNLFLTIQTLPNVGVPLAVACAALFFRIFERPFLNMPSAAPIAPSHTAPLPERRQLMEAS